MMLNKRELLLLKLEKHVHVKEHIIFFRYDSYKFNVTNVKI